MTKRDYEAFAKIFAEGMISPQHRASVEWLAHQAAEVFARDNGRFDKARFLAACGVLP